MGTTCKGKTKLSTKGIRVILKSNQSPKSWNRAKRRSYVK